MHGYSFHHSCGERRKAKSQNYVTKFGQEEEPYNIVRPRLLRRLISVALFNNQPQQLHFLLATWPVVASGFHRLGV